MNLNLHVRNYGFKVFPVVLQIYKLECHNQTSVRVAFVVFGAAFMKFKKSENLHGDKKTPSPLDLGIFTV